MMAAVQAANMHFEQEGDVMSRPDRASHDEAITEAMIEAARDELLSFAVLPKGSIDAEATAAPIVFDIFHAMLRARHRRE
jgi:hypothetical protein